MSSSDLSGRIRSEVERRLAIARAAGGWTWRVEWTGFDNAIVWSTKPDDPEIAVTHGSVSLPKPQREYLALHDPADAIRRYAFALKILNEHAIIHRDIGWLEFEEGTFVENAAEIPVCGTCVPRHSHFRTRAGVPEGAYSLVLDLAESLGIDTGGQP